MRCLSWKVCALTELTERRAHLLTNVLHELAVLHVVHEVQEDFDGREHNGRVGVIELCDYPLGHDFCVRGLLWYVAQ